MAANPISSGFSPQPVELHASGKMSTPEIIEYVKQAVNDSHKELEDNEVHPPALSLPLEHTRERASPLSGTPSPESIEADEDEWKSVEQPSDDESGQMPESHPDASSAASRTQNEGPATNIENDRVMSESHLMLHHKTLPNDDTNAVPSLSDLKLLEDTNSPTAKTSLAALLSRHKHCTCGVTVSDTGEIDPPLHEIAMGSPWIKKLFRRAHDGNYILLDKQSGRWHLICPKQRPVAALADLKVIASGFYNPYLVRKRRNNLRGLKCPCYDESCGEGTATRLLKDIYATMAMFFDKPPTGFKTTSYSLDEPSCDLSKEFFLGRARTVLEKRYLRFFPYLERQALDRHVRDEAEFLSKAYGLILEGRLIDDEIIDFHNARDFDDGKGLDDIDIQPGRRPGSFPDSPTLLRKRMSPSWEQVLSALTAKYLHTWPWLGIEACRSLAAFNNTWLQEQMHSCGPGLSRHADTLVIVFYGADDYDVSE
ncbi:uncharacterized protein PAC_00142 [Phialocephala subalpina]|uniref:Uncharacterized protein n=1 Tax=Phialocephala subalpina TaxID=576137 RepID=A0A1L7WBX1_9HELO|nr:uncharacterized protein PAC_00142 [Phialocephala subalpina]